MSTASHGYDNDKVQGRPIYDTVHGIGSGKSGRNALLKTLAERTVLPVSIVSVTPRDKDKELVIEITGHSAKKHNVLRLVTGVAAETEYDIIEIIDANRFVVRNIGSSVPAAADTAKVLFHVSFKTDSEGAIATSSGPTQFIQNGSTVSVNEDTVTPANNRPLPVKLSGITGDINITANDLNVALDHVNDSIKIGDGTDLLAVNADGSLNIGASALPSGAATLAEQQTQSTRLGDVAEVAPATDTASSGINGRLQRIAQRLSDLIIKLPSIIGRRTTADSLSVTLSSDHAALPLPTGASTELKQDNILAELQSIDNKTIASLADASNSTSVALLAGATFTGAWLEALQYSTLAIVLKSDQAGTLLIEYSHDGVTVVDTESIPVNPVDGKLFTFGCKSRYMRVSYTNGATAQTSFQLHSVFHWNSIKPSSHTANDVIVDADDCELMKSILTGKAPDNTYKNVQVTNGGNLKTAIQEFDATIRGSQLSSASMSVAISSEQEAILERIADANEKILVPTYQEDLAVTTTVMTFTAPVGAKWCKIQADSDNTDALRVKLGGVASTTSGMKLEAGRSEDFQLAGNISYCSVASTGTNKIYVIFGA